MKRNHLVVSILTLFCISLAVFLLSSCSVKHEITEIESVELKKNGEIKIKVNVAQEYIETHKREEVYLLAMDTSEGAGAKIAAKSRVKSDLTFEVSLYDYSKSRISCGFALASYTEATESAPAGYNLLTEVEYITNPEVLANGGVNTQSYSSIKGIALSDTSDVGEASYMGATDVLLEVRIDRLLTSRDAENTTMHNYSGVTYYFDNAYLEELDRGIKSASDAGMKIYLRLVLGMPIKDGEGKYPYEKIDILYCANASIGKQGYLPDMSSPEAVGYIDAMLDFVTERYKNLVSDYIVGRNMNNPAEYNNAGDLSSDRYYFFCNTYVRHVYNILRSHVSNGEVYVPINSTWASTSSGGKAFLNAFADCAKNSGDYAWNVSFALSPENPTSGIVWNDSSRANPYLTANCLYEITDFLQTSRFLHGGNMRRVIISDFSVPGQASSELEEYRSASYVYTYGKVLENGKIDAFIYSSFEGEKDSLKPSANGSTTFYNTFMTCGSNDTSIIKPLIAKIGDKWSDSLQKAMSSGERCTYISCSEVLKNTEGLRAHSVLFDFSVGDTFGFASGGSSRLSLTQYLDGEGKVCSAVSADMNSADGWTQITKKNMKASELLSSKWLSFDLSGTGGSRVVLILTDTSQKDGGIIRFRKEFTVSGQRETYCFDVSGFTSKIKSSDNIEICLMVEPSSDDDTMNLTLYGADLYGTSSKIRSFKIVIAVVAAMAIVATVAVVAFIVKGKKKSRSRDDGEDLDDDDE